MSSAAKGVVMFKRLGLSKQIMFLVLLCVMGVFANAAMYHMTLGRLSKQSAAAINRTVEQTDSFADLQRDASQVQNTLQTLLREKDPDRLEQVLAELKSRQAQLGQRLSLLGSAERELTAAAKQWESTLGEIVDTVLAGNNAPAFEKFINVLMPQHEAMLHQIDEIGRVRSTATREQASADEKSIAATQRKMLGGSIAGGLIVAVIGVWLPRRIAKPLNVAISQLQGASEQVTGAASQVSSSSQQSAQSTSEQTASIERAVAQIDQVSTMTQTSAQAATQADRLATDAQTNANKGNETMKQLDTSIQAINASASEMGKIIRVIEEIAFQTNLLALNAAVEAARAGEHGKGFAVVADEVRNLAMRSSEAAKNTGTLITESIRRAKDGASACQGVGADLKGIGEKVNAVASLLQEISASTGEQSKAASQLRKDVASIQECTMQNSAIAEESAAAAEELSSMASMMRNDIVKELTATVTGR